MADVEIEPARTGGRRITVAVYSTAKEVMLLLPEPAVHEPLRLSATHVDGATWRVDGASIPTPGRWTLRVEILINDFEKITIEDQIS
jgi:copper transport protein